MRRWNDFGLGNHGEMTQDMAGGPFTQHGRRVVWQRNRLVCLRMMAAGMAVTLQLLCMTDVPARIADVSGSAVQGSAVISMTPAWPRTSACFGCGCVEWQKNGKQRCQQSEALHENSWMTHFLAVLPKGSDIVRSESHLIPWCNCDATPS